MSTAVPSTSGSSHLGATRNTSVGGSGAGGGAVLLPPNAAQFREIHKNTWLKRLSADGKKITVGPKKSDRSWVVFCVHDDTEALLEGYAEPRQAASHIPEWIISLKDTLHISHALIPNLHEFEFVVTLSNEVIRFHSMSWEIMQEWVETLRSKLREMKILSPRENLYTKLPEVRAPLLPTRDPTSPLPAPPPVPAAIVPGVERVVTVHSSSHQREENETTITSTTTAESLQTVHQTSSTTTTTNSTNSQMTMTTTMTTVSNNSVVTTSTTPATPNRTAMSNTLTQNLLNMLSDPISSYSEKINDPAEPGDVSDEDNASDGDGDDDDDDEETQNEEMLTSHASSEQDLNQTINNEFSSPLLRKSTSPLRALRENNVRLDIGITHHRASADQIINLEHLLQCERLIPRPQTSRSMSAGAADKTKKPRQKSNKSQPPVNQIQTETATEMHMTRPETNQNQTPSLLSSIEMSTINGDGETATNTNITIIKVSTNACNDNDEKKEEEFMPPPKLPTKTITGEIFRFPEITTKINKKPTKQHEYKSNVQIIPSNANSSTIQVLGGGNQSNHSSSSTPIKTNTVVAGATTTMVHVIGGVGVGNTSSDISSTLLPAVTAAAIASPSSSSSILTTTSVAVYGTCYTSTSVAGSSIESTQSQQQPQQHTPKLSRKVILTANSSGITNITVNNDDESTKSMMICNKATTTEAAARINDESSNSSHSNTSDVKHNVGNVHYEKVFLSSSIPIPAEVTTTSTNNPWQSPRRHAVVNNLVTVQQVGGDIVPQTSKSTPTPAQSVPNHQKIISTSSSSSVSSAQVNNGASPVLPRRHVISPSTQQQQQQQQPLTQNITNIIRRPPVLTRGLTEAVITTRPSRRDFHYMKLLNQSTPIKTTKTNNKLKNTSSSSMANNNIENSEASVSTAAAAAAATSKQPFHPAVNRVESVEQRRRSSSTSDAQAPLQRNHQHQHQQQQHQRGANNNVALRMQQPPQPYRGMEHSANNSSIHNSTSSATTAPPKRLTLREQQVIQLRREIMHPGGVRLQLRRKDCLGSIAWVDAFGAVWVAGWKQKEHPVLYNALHIGDQLLSIAGVSISSATEANKVIRNTNTLFLEVLVRRIPFGRAYAIRRDREGQCLGLIRDGNTSTIVDVVPNSLAARHGLPPKAQSCDGSTLTFWMLTEINGRPLNLFFKDNEIRDRLNSVGRDISILVQPSDLVTKLKKQLKSMRGYKDYLVQ